MDIDLIKQEFPLEDGLIYLNHAAVAPWPARTRDAVRQFAEENSRTGAQHYQCWLQKESALRSQIQRLLNAPSSDDIALLKNTSEALSVVAAGLDWQAGDNVVISAEEFPSNRIPWQSLARRGVELREVNIRGETPEQALQDHCDDRTRLLSISSVQYGSGIRLDLQFFGQFCHDRHILFCIDAIQSLGAITMDVQALQADFVMADAHKWLLGPEGIALFYSNPAARERLRIYQYGWHMVENIDFNSREWQIARSARRFECGSPNMLGIYALSASLTLLEEIGYQQVEKMVLNNSAYLIDKLEQINSVQLLTPTAESRHAGIINFTVAGKDLLQIQNNLLRSKVICVYRGGGLRFSPHFYITENLLDKAVDILNISICNT
ncbi:MAG: class V aminotransferase [Gammaproteobacteria bacterium RIFCSPLOWO2_12_FULL_52_10]|nr:MAG: class V aminotransferase [Gammaproteobacteria bacterium RIFCSPLOWO2_12_FULL_52_10]